MTAEQAKALDEVAPRLTEHQLAVCVDTCRKAGAENAGLALSKHVCRLEAEIAHERYNRLTNLEVLCFVAGWQGGTIHQMAKCLAVSTSTILDANRNEMLVLCGKAQDHAKFTGRTPDYLKQQERLTELESETARLGEERKI